MSVARVRELLRIVDSYGPMHITVEDGNCEDSHLDFIEREMAKHAPNEAESELLALLRGMTVDERLEALNVS